MRRYVFFITTIIASLLSCERNIYVSKENRNWEKTAIKDTAGKIWSIYLIGDVGKPYSKESCLNALSGMLNADSNSSTVFLGDNVYPDGLPLPGQKDRAEGEKILDRQLETVKDYKGKTFFIPGNHDWDYMGKGGWDRVREQEKYVESKSQKGNIFLPDNGCPGPVKVSITDEIVMIFIDTQWWLHDYRKPYGRGYGCTTVSKNDILVQLRDIINKNKGRHIVISAHHPLFSNGNHGGYYNAVDHIFPLRLLNKYKWYGYIPLPGIGSVYPLYRKFGGSDQDISSYEYQSLKKELMTIFKENKEIIYVAGHEHNLQYYKSENFHHIISGSGCKITPLRAGGDVTFADKEHGFVRLTFYTNGEAWAEFFEVHGDDPKPVLAFKTMLYKKFEIYPESYCTLSREDYTDSLFTVKASEKYKSGGLERIFLGKHYRKEWATPIQVPILDLKTEEGGLIPYALGGGKQSISLKFKNPDDQEYVGRSIEKDPSIGALPEEFANTIIQDVVQDQISSQHPYGAVAIPPLANAVKILHTKPRLKYIPQDSCLGPYFDKFSNTLVLFEEDPDEAHTDAPNLANAKEIIGTDRLLEELAEDNDNSIDQYAFVRARLLDMVIGDWDRHKGQYRWAELKKEGKGKIYLPVPEDHDQAFFRFDGVIPYIFSRRWAIRTVQDFDDDYHDIRGLNFTAKEIDRRFANVLTREEWLAIADTIKTSLTDSVIEYAVKQLPAPVFAISGNEIIHKLKSRRDQLSAATNTYFDIISEFVDVYGSNKHELFLVERLNDNETKVAIYKIKKSGEVKKALYERTIKTNETREIRLYGLGGEDYFRINGNVNKSVRVRIIGGDGRDTIIDNSSVKGPGNSTVVYDTDSTTYLQKSKETRDQLSNSLDINDPDSDKFFYNYWGPQINLGYNQGDGVFLGAGALLRTYKFRGDPYGARHKLMYTFANATNSSKINYYGDFRRAILDKDFTLNIDFYLPYFTMNYFGYGNNSPEPKGNINYYRILMKYININPMMVKRIRKFLETGIGPKYEYYKLTRQENSIINQDVLPVDNTIYQPGNYVGLRTYFKLGSSDNQLNPTRGLILNGEATANKQIDGPQRFYTQIKSDLTIYLTPNLPKQLTFAARIGAARNDGDYLFYQTVPLGGTTNLRGYYRSRFIGDRIFYQNVEVRAEILNLNAYLLSGKTGLTAFLDNGRVWPGKPGSHQGYGGGAWINVANKFIFNLYYGFSEERGRFLFNFGYFF